MNPLYVLPSLVTALLLLLIGAYLLLNRTRKPYISILAILALTMFIWNVGVLFTNLTDGAVIWAKLSTAALIFIPPLIFHFTATYTNFFRTKKYLIAYVPFFLLTTILPTDLYVTGVDKIGFGYEPAYALIPFTIHSWGGFMFLLFSIFMLVQYYRESVGIKQRQILLILFAIPTNALLSYVSFSIMVDVLEIAQFPVGALLDAFMVILVVYAVIHYKLPTPTGAEIDFRLLAETASEGICIVDHEGNIDYANSHFTDLVNNSTNEVLGRPLKHFVTVDDAPKFQDALRSTLDGDKITNLGINLQRQTSILNIEINTSPILWDEKIIGAFVTIRDITERKQTEQELERQKTHFQALFESSPEAIVSMDSRHRVLDVNPAFTAIFGYSAEDLLNKNIDDYILPDEYGTEGRDLTAHVITGKITKLESIRQCKDGSLIPVSILGAPIFVAGTQVGIYAIYRDISDRKEAEEEREFYNSLLRHDVANRNMVVQGNLEILDSLHLTAEQQNLVSNALNAVKASTNLIQKIRDLRAIEGEHNRTPIDLQKAIEGAVQASRQQALERSVSITVDGCETTVMAGPFIDSIITNILQNAIIHSGCSNINISCDTATFRDINYCALTIADDGMGVAPEVTRDIFRPGIKRRGSPGSGLGLYLVKKMIENYGGRITVQNRVGNGTAFTLYLEPA